MELVELVIGRVQLRESLIHYVIFSVRRLTANVLESTWSRPYSGMIGCHQQLDNFPVAPNDLAFVDATGLSNILYSNFN